MKINKFAIVCLVLFTTLIGNLSISASINDSLVSEIIIKRHSGKNYSQSELISYDQILSLMEAARWAPSSYNDQPWNFILCEKDMTHEDYEKVLNCLIPSQKKWAENAPILVVIVARKKFQHNGKPNEWAEYDTGAAVQNLALQAVEIGLMAHSIGGFDKEKLIQDLHIPADFQPMCVVAIGYEVADEVEKPRIRKPIGENFFFGKWGHPLEN